MEIIKQLLHDYLVLFAMVNAVGNLPIFADSTVDYSKQERNKIFNIATLTGGSIVLAFALFGDIMLRNVFAVSTDAFKIAGGILVFIVAARGVILGTKHSIISDGNDGNVAIFPLGFPYLAGPGTILSAILLIQSDGRLLAVITVIAVYLSILPLLRLSNLVEKALGKVGVMVIARILYIFICAKAVSFILEGIQLKI